MSVIITTLSENVAGMPDILAEWGLSLLVEVGGYTVLLDTGRSISASHNVDVMNVDLSKINSIVLSHGHYDHLGGLHDLLVKMRRRIEIIAHPDIWEEKIKHKEGKEDKFVGMPFRRSELESLGAVFRLTREPIKLNDNIWTTGEVPMVTDFESIDSGMYVKESGEPIPDDLLDDRALAIKTERGLVVVSGCAHRGIVNTILYSRKLTGVDKLYAVVGGSHLVNAKEKQVWQTIGFFKDAGVQRLGLCHCTGLPAMGLFAQEFPNVFFYNSAGDKVDLFEEKEK